MSDAVTGCAQTPLWNLLRRIPQEAVYNWRTPEEGRELWQLGSESAPIGRLAHEAAATLEALAASPSGGGWEDISTAPKDGTLVDLWASYGERVAGAKWTNGVWREWALDGFDSMGWVRLEGTATHWMPLPPPPVSTGSRPQEAVPTEGPGAAVLALKEIIPAVEAYLMSGDDLAQALKRQTWGPALKRARQRAAEGCSSNEGAGK